MKKDPYEKEFTKALRKEGKNVGKALSKAKKYSHKAYTGAGSEGSGVFGRKKVKGGYEEYLEA